MSASCSVPQIRLCNDDVLPEGVRNHPHLLPSRMTMLLQQEKRIEWMSMPDQSCAFSRIPRAKTVDPFRLPFAPRPSLFTKREPDET